LTNYCPRSSNPPADIHSPHFRHTLLGTALLAQSVWHIIYTHHVKSKRNRSR
jgi:hypothetical protein